MTETTTAHTARTRQAEELGYNAGWEHYMTSVEVCPPEEWTPTSEQCWKALLRELRVNPYDPDQYPHQDATDDQNQHYAKQWELAFVKGSNAARSQHGRRAA